MFSRLPFFAIIAFSAIAGGCAHDNFGQTAEVGSEIRVSETANDAGRAAAVAGWTSRTALVEGSGDLGAENGPYLLDTGDKLRVFVYGQPSISRLYTVDHDGRISVPLIGPVQARGLTTYGLEKVLRTKLGASYVRDPQVTVDVQQNRPFFIHGEVRSAGQFPYVNGLTAEAAIAIAGGYSERADRRRLRVTRRMNGEAAVFELAPTDRVLPGDVVYVTERFF